MTKDPAFAKHVVEVGDELGSTFGDIWESIAAEDKVPPRRGGEGFHTDVGVKRSFVPILGRIETPLSMVSGADCPFYGYTFQVDGTRLGGYVRVPHYKLSLREVEQFLAIGKHFESEVEAVLIDQTMNPGGSMFHMYGIASALTDKPLALPTHKMLFDQDDIDRAHDTLERFNAVSAVGESDRPSTEAVRYSRFVLEEFYAGRGWEGTLTRPGHVGGFEQVLPAECPFTGPLFIYSNELSFSAAEFFAAIMKDNGRAKLLGLTTAGAGGCARRSKREFKHLGLPPYVLSLTWTVATRTNGQLIQNLGVEPDVVLQVTQSDVAHGFVDLGHKLVAAMFGSRAVSAVSALVGSDQDGPFSAT